MAVIWVVAPCSLVITLMMEAASTSETSVNFYQTTRRINPEVSHLITLSAADLEVCGRYLVQLITATTIPNRVLSTSLKVAPEM
jgi:hypothetical protein